MRLALTLALALSLAPLSGCGINSSTSTAGASLGSGSASHFVGGHVHGGQQPVNGAVMQLWAVGTAGYGSAATPLITAKTVNTDATGFFDLTGDYTCPGNPLVYLTATGGNTGGSGNNDNLLLVAPLGYCSSLSGSTQIQIDEVTTVAAAYALGQFTNTATGSIGSWSYSTTGLANAFTTVNNLVDTTMGTALVSTPSGVGNVPQSSIDTLGNIMASCVNSVSSNASLSTNCAAYFAAATPPGGAEPTDTFDAMVNIAHNPGQNVSTLFNLAVADPPFNPVLSTAPGDWTIGISWKVAGSSTLSVDSAGNVWHLGNGTSALSPAGVLTRNTAFLGYFMALDTNDHAWLYNSDGELMGLQLTTTGGVSSISSFAGPFPLPPAAGGGDSNMAIDAANNIWMPLRDGLTEVNTSGTVLGTFAWGGSDSAYYNAAVDSNGNIWVSNWDIGSLDEFSNSGTALSPSGGFTGGSLGRTLGAPAIDASNNVWLANTLDLFEFSPSGALLSPDGGYGGGGQGDDVPLAIDGNGTAWAGSANGVVSVSSSGVAISPNNTGYNNWQMGPINHLAIDASGNLWFTGTLARGSNPIGLIEDVGLAAPVITPMPSAIATHQLGTRPGTPIPVVLTSTEIPPTFGTNIPYSAQLYVTGGNTGTYLWSIASGALPSGFTLNSSTGLLSGSSPDSGTASFTVQVCDAQNATNCASRAFTLTPAAFTGLPALGGESLLNGTYVVRITGMQNAGASSAPGSVQGTALVGFLHLNGSGNLSSGNFYVAGPQETFESTTPVGYYDLPASGTGPGRLVFYDEDGKWFQFSIVADKIVGGVAQEIRLTEFDDTQAGAGQSGGAMASGIGKLQTVLTTLLSYLQHPFAFGLEGETPCTNFNNANPTCGQTVAPFGPVAAAGVLTGTSSTALSGEWDASGVGTSYNSVGITGTWQRSGGITPGSFTLAYTGTLFPVPPTDFAYFPVSDSEFFFISTDSHTNTSLLSGDAIAQTAPLNTGILNGNYLGVESVASGGDGVSVYGSTVNSTIRLIDSNGATAAIVADENAAGTLTQLTFQGNSNDSVDSAGRTTFTQAGLPIFYLANGTQGFGVEQPTAGNPPGLITLTQQTNATLDATSLSGAYGYGTLNVPAQNTTADGILTADGVSAGTITADEVSAGGLLYSPSQTLTYTMATGGRGTLTLADGTGYIVWMLSPTQWIALPTGTDPKPLTLTGTHQ